MSDNYSDPELDNNLLSILNQDSMLSQNGPNQPNPKNSWILRDSVRILLENEMSLMKITNWESIGYRSLAYVQKLL